MTIGAELLGVIGPHGTLLRLPRGYLVDQTFVAIASQGRPPEQRFRFASSCVEGRCKNWKDGKCQVPEVAGERLGFTIDADSVGGIKLQPCKIRSTCRWYFQGGRQACELCDLVVTDPDAYEVSAAEV